MTSNSDIGATSQATAVAWEVSDYLRILSWLCWLAAALSFFGIASGAITLTTAWIETAFGLFVFGFVLRHVPEDVREMANEPRENLSFYLRILGWAGWVASAFIFFAVAGTLIQRPTTAWIETAFGLFVSAFVLRRAPARS
jgi:uncharacterized membrane protein YidH (DUF202 family)